MTSNVFCQKSVADTSNSSPHKIDKLNSHKLKRPKCYYRPRLAPNAMTEEDLHISLMTREK